MTFAVGAKVVSSLTPDLKKYERDLDRAGQAGLKGAGGGFKKDLRGQVTRAGLGTGVARAWRDRLFVDGLFQATAFVWTKAPDIIRAFDRGTVIRSKDGFFLAVPTDAAPKKGRGGKRLTPSNFPEETLGNLRFVFRHGAPSLLVVDGLVARGGKRGGFRRATIRKASKKRGAFVSLQGLTTVPMFTLVPLVKPKKLLDVAGAASKWARRVPDLIDRDLAKAA